MVLNLQGLDTPTPFLQLGGNIFKGHFETLLGSEILFKEGLGERNIICFNRGKNVMRSLPKDPKERGRKIVVPQGIASEQRVRFNHLILKTREEMEEEARKQVQGGTFPIIQETFSGAKSANGGSGEGMSVPPWQRGVRRGRGRGPRTRGKGKGTGKGRSKGKGKERAQESEKGIGEGESDWMDVNEGPEGIAE